MPTPSGTKRNNGKRQEHADNCWNMQKSNATKKALIKTPIDNRHQFYAPGTSFMPQPTVLCPRHQFKCPRQQFYTLGTRFMPQATVLCPRQQFYGLGKSFMPRAAVLCPRHNLIAQAQVLCPRQQFYAPGNSFMPQATVLCPRHKFYAPGTSFMPQSAVLVFDQWILMDLGISFQCISEHVCNKICRMQSFFNLFRSHCSMDF